MPQFSDLERTWIVQKIESGATYLQAQLDFYNRFRKNAPAIKNMRSIVQKFRQHFTVKNRNSGNSGRRRSGRTEENIDRVRQHMDEQNQSSMRATSQIIGLSKSTVHRIVKKELNKFPYKSYDCDVLSDNSKNRRMEFARIARESILPSLDNVWFSDESYVTLTGYRNRQNDRTWALKRNNPHTRVDKQKFPRKVMVWAAINAIHGIIYVIMPQANVNTAIYINMLRTEFIPNLQRMNVIENALFMQDGARAHTSQESLNFLYAHFGNRIISHRYENLSNFEFFILTFLFRAPQLFEGAVEWPPYSPDLNPCDFFLWSFLKKIVAERKPHTMNELTAAIRGSCEAIPQPFIANAIRSLPQRLERVLESRGDRFF